MKPYAVEVGFTMIVMAEDEDGAHEVAQDNADDEWRHGQTDFAVCGVVRSVDDLSRYGWDGDSIPYGGEGDTCLRTILTELPPVVERDTRTIDMFEDQES